MNSLEVTDEQSKAVQKTGNRVSLKSLEDKIISVEYIYPDTKKEMTIAVVKMVNGFVILGESAPADVKNFDEELGKKFAYENALRKIWPLEGYVLCEELRKPVE